jgi:ubiquitin-conjugating enzyme E2 H
MSSVNERRKMGDLVKLANSGVEFYEDENELNTYYICIQGPKDTPYEDGYYWIRMHVTKDYPFKSPSIAFMTPIFHPNIEYNSGAICLDALNEEWTPVFHFERIINIMIPQLMMYPNASDPFNTHASELYLSNKSKYDMIARDVHNKYAHVKGSVPYNRIERDSSLFDFGSETEFDSP